MYTSDYFVEKNLMAQFFSLDLHQSIPLTLAEMVTGDSYLAKFTAQI